MATTKRSGRASQGRRKADKIRRQSQQAVGAGLGGAALGAAIFGPYGALIGGVVGLALGAADVGEVGNGKKGRPSGAERVTG